MTEDERLVSVTPSERQVMLQRLEFYAFIHFTVNTFTDREWGTGDEDPAVFAPRRLDAEQWARAVRSAGMRGLILTCKHHDGFCLWPSRTTAHSVAASPFRNGRGDVVRETAEACRKYGLRFGVYLSPWDRNCPLYGSGRAYDDFFVAQLTELLTGYGELFSVWFDGACGEGPNGRKQVYDWPRYFRAVRELQPGACISICGPDVRWCGNEAGRTRAAEWSVVPARLRTAEHTAAVSQHSDGPAFRLRPISSKDEDLGSRERLRDEPELVWYPAETDVSIRPGWFWHEEENDRVRPLGNLLQIYFGTVGGNSTLLLNVPPTREGLLHENDVKRLGELGGFLRAAFACDLAPGAALSASPAVPGCPAENAVSADPDTYYMPAGGVPAELTLTLRRPEALGYLVLQENIRMSQRVERFTVELADNGAFREVYASAVIGYKRIVPLHGVRADAVRLRIEGSRCAPALSFIGVYRAASEDAPGPVDGPRDAALY